MIDILYNTYIWNRYIMYVRNYVCMYAGIILKSDNMKHGTKC